ncbi:MAG TPA: choice-of-anchor J domain-containing protein [Ferruginibacter sp.]|nr:choice-of-anchor J domain-containing protein [Ferruginibacter sp.]
MLILFMSIITSNSKAQLLINEGFSTVLPSGWAQQNLSTPVGTNPNWFQGNTTVFNAFSGAATSYAACNFNSVAGANTISNWLFTPQVTLANGNVIEFYTRVPTGGGAFPDRLELRMSTNGASVNAGATNSSVGDFTTLLLSVNPSLTSTGYPENWTKFTATISGLGAPTSGRFAFRYFVTDGGPFGNNSNYIGIDEVQYGAPCSGTPNPGNTVSSVTTICSGIPFNLSLQNPPAALGITYQWQSGPSATGPWTNITGATNPTLTTSITAATYFQCVVSCGANSAASTPVQITMNPPLACYCIPSPASDCTDDDVIERVTVGGMNKTSTCAASGYSNYTSTDTASLIVGGSNPITVVTGDSWSEQVGVWIDYDRSGSFEASEFTNLGLTTAGSGGIHNGAIAVPSTVATGYTRMRVRVRFSTALTGTQACLGYAFGETEDYTVNLVPCVPVTITSQPVNRTIACAANTTFTVGLAGSLPVAYWEYRTSASGVWQNVVNGGVYSGANTTTLTLTTVPQAMSGYQFRAVYAGACNGVDFSNAATLTITPLVATVSNSLPITRCISDAPTQITVTNLSGATATASTASGTLHTLIPDNNDETIGQNTNAINHSINVTNVPGGVTINGFSVRVNLTHAWVGDMIMVLRAPNGKTISLDYALSATGGAGPTTGFTNTIISSKGTALLSSGANPYTGTFRLDNVGASTPGFTPTGPAGYDPNTTVLSEMFQGNGTWTLAMYDYYGDFTTANFLENWEINIDYGAPATGVFTPATGLFTDAAGTVPYTGTAINTVYANPAATTTYSLVVTTPNCVSAALSIPVRVGSPISGSSSVNNAAVCTGGNAAFKATAPTGGANRTYQWQESTDAGASWNNVANGTHYTGATTDSLTILDATNTMNNNRYRVVMTVAECSSILNSAAGTLTVNPLPVLTVSANPYTAIYPGQTTTLAVASSTTVPANGYQWYRNGVAVAGATGNTLVVDVDGLGEYTVTANDANSCGNANTPSISITEAPNSILFIYPSPNSGQFQVRYYSQAGNSPLPRLLNIYDSKGSRVYSKQYNIAAPYARMDVDLSNLSAGIYHVELLDRTGNRIKTGRVLIQK